jgi:hypothetical protein
VGSWGQEQGTDGSSPQPAPEPEQKPHVVTLVDAAMCEKIENLDSVNKAVVFPVSIGQVYCLTNFDPVPNETLIYHRWYHADDLSTQVRLRLHPPNWATFSTIQLREADKGPWRVEVTDQDGRIFTILRFSITD